ncbi:hypothetical protein DMP15_17795 [Pseudonocardia sp. UM4_GMWB1]
MAHRGDRPRSSVGPCVRRFQPGREPAVGEGPGEGVDGGAVGEGPGAHQQQGLLRWEVQGVGGHAVLAGGSDERGPPRVEAQVGNQDRTAATQRVDAGTLPRGQLHVLGPAPFEGAAASTSARRDR